MKSRSFIITGALIAAIAMGGPMAAFAASKKGSASPAASASPSAKGGASTSEKSARAVPFHGTVSSVDESAKTFAIQGKTASRVFKVTEKTTVKNAGQEATFAEIKANENISGSYWKQADGSLECKSVNVGGISGGSKSSKKKGGDAATAGASPAASASPSPSSKK